MPQAAQIEPGPRIVAGPSPPASVAAAALPAPSPGAAPRTRFDALPVPDFVEAVFVDALDMPVRITPEVRDMHQPVSLRLQGVPDRDALLGAARLALAKLGVAIAAVDGVLEFRAAPATGASGVPVPVDPDALPSDVAPTQPVFAWVPLAVVGTTKVSGWFVEALGTSGLSVEEDPDRNAILLAGTPAEVEDALALVRVLDRPHPRAGHSLRVEPVRVDAGALAQDLERVLQSEGIGASQRGPAASVIVLPLKSSKALVVFAPEPGLLEHVKAWAAHLDRGAGAGVGDGIFSYLVQHTTASALVDTLAALPAPQADPRTPARAPPAPEADEPAEPQPDAPQTVQRPAARARVSPAPGVFVADTNRNAVLFRGSAAEWLRLLPVIQAMDTPAPAVLVEVFVAELRLGDRYASGVEWLADGSIGDFGIDYGTLGGLGLGDEGFRLQLDEAGRTRALVELMHGDDRIEIRSRPRLVVQSGHEARLDVGDEIPLLSSSSRSTDSPDAPVVNNVEYRRTGIELAVRPRVHGAASIELDIAQRISEARETTSSDIDSPTILNREISATANLRDGGSVLIGGLRIARENGTRRGMPLLGRLPVLRPLASRQGSEGDQSELLVLVVARLLRTPEEAERASEALRPPR